MSAAVERNHEAYLYQQVIHLIKDMKEQSALRPGDKLPSLRSLAEKLNISVPTVKQAYQELERIGEIEARPKSGYFLVPQSVELSRPQRIKRAVKPTLVKRQSLIEEVYDAIHKPGNLPLGIANPVAAYPSDKALARIMRRVMSHDGARAIAYGPMDGHPELKRQLAVRYLNFGLQVSPDDLVITNGAQEALAIALKCVAKPGDIIAVESPCYFGILELIESLGMMAYEIPVCSDDGIWLEDLASSLKEINIKACVFSTSITNPMGSFMPDSRRKLLVELLEKSNIPLIEDDVYGDLYFTEQRGTPAQYFSKKGLVITCASFSKTAAPSYRIGWLISNKYIEKARRFKRALSCSSPLINQKTLSEFVASGDYDRTMRHLRQTLCCNKDRMVALIHKYFPENIRLSDPQGGAVLWVELPKQCDTVELFYQALEHKISISPGVIFSPTNKYKHCFRITYGLPWSEQLERGIKKLGDLVSKMTLVV